MDSTINQIYTQAVQEIEAATTTDAVHSLNTKYLGRKGVVTQFLRNISTLPKQERPTAGKEANQVKQKIDAACTQAIR